MDETLPIKVTRLELQMGVTDTKIDKLDAKMDAFSVKFDLFADKMEDRYLTKQEFVLYKAVQAELAKPTQEVRSRVTSAVISAVTYAVVIGLMIVLTTYINYTVLGQK